MELKDLCMEMEIIARETGRFIMKESRHFKIGSVESKGHNDFVSYVDRGAERKLVERLGKLIPEAGFNVEEGGIIKKGARYCWIVDPLDGTTNFLHGLHPFSISIALKEHDEIVAGLVLEAGGGESFKAWKQGGAWLNGKEIRVSDTIKLSDSLIATGFPYRDFSRLSSYLKCLEHLIRTTHGVRRMGSAAIDLAYVACGRFDGFFEYGLNPWDVAAGSLLVKEAGGRVSDFSGKENGPTGKEIIAANGHAFSEFLENVSKFMLE